MSKLAELCINITDGEHNSVKETVAGGFYFLNNNNIHEYEIVVNNEDKEISENEFLRINKRTKIETGDVLISTCGNLGKSIVVKDTDLKYVYSRSVGIIKPDKRKLNSAYLNYYFKLPTSQSVIKNRSKGGSQKHFYISDLIDFDIVVPSIEEQKKRIAVLNTIDQKIINNNHINSELESMAKTIYDYWFLQFEFPNEEGKPYKSSGGKMVWNDELKREIPEGWEVKELGNLLDKKNRPHNYNNNINTIDLSVMPSNSISLNQLNESKNFETNLFGMKKGDLLFGSIRPYLRKAGVAPCDGAVAGTVHCYEVKNNDNYNLCMAILCSENLFNYAINISKGTKMPVVSSDDLLSFKTPYDKEIAKKFNFLNIKDIICENVMENQELASLRDFLLPMLMNGQVTFKEKDA